MSPRIKRKGLENGSSKEAERGVDASLLRSALRLVHCLQKERGASCAYFAATASKKKYQNLQKMDNNNYQNPIRALELMEHARCDCDSAITYMYLKNNTNERDKAILKVQATIHKIRSMIRNNKMSPETSTNKTASEACTNNDNGEETAESELENSRNGPSVHRILVCFDAVVSNVVHEYFLEHVAFKRNVQQSRRTDSLRSRHKGGGGGRHMRSRSEGGNVNTDLLFNFFDDDGDDLLPPPPPPPLPPPPPSVPPPSILTTSKTPSPTRNNYDTEYHYHKPLQNNSKHISFTNSSNEDDESHDHEDEDDAHHRIVADSKRRVLRLLNVLGVFVRLKESTGRERAILSIILVAGLNIDSKFHNDLVLEVENQRRLIGELTHLPAGSMRNLVSDSVAMSRELLDLQNKILAGLNAECIEPYHSSATNAWDLITLYIDKLHSVELLILEEIEYCNLLVTVENMQGGIHGTMNQILEDDAIGAAASSDADNNNLQQEELKNSSQVGSSAESAEIKTIAKTESATAAQQPSQTATTPMETPPSKPNAAESEDESEDNTNSILIGEDPYTMLTNSAPASKKEWEINLYELKFLRRIGEGAAGTTYLATWTGQQVAVKVASITETGLEGFRTEVEALQKLHHPNIIRLLGSVYHQNPLTFCLVLEHCNAGDLNTALTLPTPKNFFFHVATSVANGMSYLHSRGIIHRDIKPSNVLLDGNIPSGQFHVKVSDFGVATDIDLKDSNKVKGDRTGETGTYRWMAPEVIRHKPYSNMADIYSFAIMMWQLLTREEPFVDLSQIEAAGKVALEGARPPLPRSTPKFLEKLIAKNWSKDPSERLPFDEISKELKTIQKGLIEVERKWLEAPLGHPVYYPRSPSSSHVGGDGDGSDDGDSDDDSNNPNNNHRNLLMIPAPPISQKQKECKRPSLFRLFSSKGKFK